MMLAVSEEEVLIAGVLEVADTDTLVEEIARRTARFIPKLIPHKCCFTCKCFEGDEVYGVCSQEDDGKAIKGKHLGISVSQGFDCRFHERKEEYHYYWSYGDDGEKDELVGVPNPAFDQSLCDFLSDWCQDAVCPNCEPEPPFR